MRISIDRGVPGQSGTIERTVVSAEGESEWRGERDRSELPGWEDERAVPRSGRRGLERAESESRWVRIWIRIVTGIEIGIRVKRASGNSGRGKCRHQNLTGSPEDGNWNWIEIIRKRRYQDQNSNRIEGEIKILNRQFWWSWWQWDSTSIRLHLDSSHLDSFYLDTTQIESILSEQHLLGFGARRRPSQHNTTIIGGSSKGRDPS